MPIRQTHTYAILPVSRAAFDEIKQKLTDAGYQHAFHDDVIDMQGIGLRADETESRYFVCLIHPQTGVPIPMTDGEDDDVPMLFDSEAYAEDAVKRHHAAQAWGYEIIPWRHK